MRPRAGGDEQVEIGAARRAQTRVPRLRRLADHVDRLPETVLARLPELAAARLPQRCHGPLLPDQHPRSGPAGVVDERLAAEPRGYDVRAEVAERGQNPVLVLDTDEAALPASGDVFEEHPLDRALGAVREDLLGRGLDHAGPHRADTLSAQPTRVPPCQSTYVRTRVTTPRPASCRVTHSGRSTSPRPSWRTSSSGTPSGGCWATRGRSTANPSPSSRPAWGAPPRPSSSRSSSSSASRSCCVSARAAVCSPTSRWVI